MHLRQLPWARTYTTRLRVFITKEGRSRSHESLSHKVHNHPYTHRHIYVYIYIYICMYTHIHIYIHNAQCIHTEQESKSNIASSRLHPFPFWACLGGHTLAPSIHAPCVYMQGQKKQGSRQARKQMEGKACKRQAGKDAKRRRTNMCSIWRGKQTRYQTKGGVLGGQV